ncbi:MAG: hypothetical protein QOJ73_4085, partial [Streptosporangiaceae bacterium]|nr:hypothetical protein [Streptosporangiaceae bacterium]
MGVDAQGHGGIGVAKARGDDVDRDPCQETGRERFTNRVEYLKLRNGEMGLLSSLVRLFRCLSCIKRSRDV